MLIADWKRDQKDAYLYPKDRQVILNLEKMIPESYKKFYKTDPEALEELGKLKIDRTAFWNHLGDICRYIDFFIEFYDPDKELPAIFLNLKNAIDDEVYQLTDIEFAQLLYKRLLGGGLKQKIYKMVCEQLTIDITVSQTTGRVYTADDDFTNADAARLQAISMIMKIAIPILEHYILVSKFVKTSAAKFDLISDVFKELFYGIGNVSDYELVQFGSQLVDRERALKELDDRAKRVERYQEAKRTARTRKEIENLKKLKVDPYEDAEQLYKKMYEYVRDRMKKHLNSNRPIWQQHAALRGVTENSRQDLLLDKYIFYDNFFKFAFDQNVVSFLQSVANMQLGRTIISVKYKKDPVQIDIEKDNSGYSAIDRYEETLMKMDENKVIRIHLSIEEILAELEKEYGGIPEEWISYYEAYPLNENSFRNYLLSNMFANLFNGFVELDCMSNRDRIKLSIIGKSKLRNEGYTELPCLLTSTSSGKVTSRILQNTRFISDFEASPNYKYAMDNLYPSLAGRRDNMILEDVSKILNNTYCYVEHNVPEITGKPIEFDKAIMANEYLNFLLRVA